MPEIVVAKSFLLTLDGKEPRRFDVGIHKDVEPEVAGHWFTKAHLAKDGKLPEPASTSPLTNEERLSVKVSLDAAEDRARVAQEEAKAARSERDGIKSGFDKLASENGVLKARVAELEDDLDKMTKPVNASGASVKK